MAQRAADQITLNDLTDGVSVIMSSESYSFPGSLSAALGGSTTTKLVALMGADVVAASVNVANVVKPAGVTVASDNHATSPTLTVTVSTSVTSAGEVVIPVVVGALTIEKKFSFSIAFKGATGSNGSNGVSSILVGLKNESYVIPCTSAGATIGASTISVDFFGWVGTTRTAVTAVVGTLPSGVTVGTNTAGTTGADGVLTFAVAAASTLGGTDAGTIPVTLTCNGQSRIVAFSWAKAKQGVAGVDGTNGADAITLEVSSSNGLLFKNTQVATVLTARVYKGGVEQVGAALTALGAVKWYKNGTYLTGKDGVSLTVAAGDVVNSATFEARLDG